MAKFFDIRSVINEVPDAQIYMFIGERSNGKTYSSLSYALDKYVENGARFVYIRRLAESVRAQYMRNLFWGNTKTGDVANHMNKLGYVGLQFFSGAFWCTVENEQGRVVRLDEPCGYTQAISTWETSKGASIPYADTIIFDEFITRGSYFDNEPVLFENLISSIVRDSANAQVIMLANTVSWNCPYFREWGLNHIRTMKQGTFNIYQSGDNQRKIVVCYTEHTDAKASDIYFSYDNPRSRMITKGVWETAEYPLFSEVSARADKWYYGEPCYVQSIDGYGLKLQPICTDDGMDCLLVFHMNRNLIDETGVDKRYIDRVIYTDYFFPYANCRMALTKHTDDLSKFILNCLKLGKVFYENNEVGENLRNYLKWSIKYSPIPN